MQVYQVPLGQHGDVWFVGTTTNQGTCRGIVSNVGDENSSRGYTSQMHRQWQQFHAARIGLCLTTDSLTVVLTT